MRRCNSNQCLLDASKKSRTFDLQMPVAHVLSSPMRDWQAASHRGGIRLASDRKLSVDWKKFNIDEYLFTHCTIVSSVETEPNGFYIKPACSELVNSNGNSWSNPVLLATFKSFIGGENYYEHVQIPELSKGKILDAILRPVKYVSKKGKGSANVYYCDILVATNRIHRDIVSRVESGELSTLSMGCLAHIIQCSKCGKVIEDDADSCEHLKSELMTTFFDSDGVERIVSEMCGRSFLKDGEFVGDPDSVDFIEGSWVENPAFAGAVMNYVINSANKRAKNILQLPTKKLANMMEDLWNLRVADASGMLVLRVVRAELLRRRREGMIERVASRFHL